MLLVKDKWEEYVVDHSDGDEAGALEILSERVEQGFWYDDQEAARAEKIVSTSDGDTALKFLLSRRDYEYEWVEIASVR